MKIRYTIKEHLFRPGVWVTFTKWDYDEEENQTPQAYQIHTLYEKGLSLLYKGQEIKLGHNEPYPYEDCIVIDRTNPNYEFIE